MKVEKKISLSFFLLTGFLLLLNVSLQAQSQDEILRTRILFLLDASGSMHGTWGPGNKETRITSAKRILTEIVDSLEKDPNVELALRIYGHLSPVTSKNCKDTQLEVGFSRSSGSYIKTKLAALNPKGVTPIAYSLEKAGDDFPPYKSRNIIILMTDGEESCGGDPCQISMLLEKKGIVMKHFVIGIGVEEKSNDAFDCIGSYYGVEDQYSFKNVLENIIKRVMNKTTTQVNLLDSSGKPTETDVNMTFYNAYNDLPRYNIYHSLSPKGDPDTLSIDPVSDYDILINTLPPVWKNSVSITPNIHNTIEIPAPQGYLEVLLHGKTINNNLNNKIKCIVKQKGKGETVNVQDFNTTEKYLTGKYDLEILTLPRTYLNDVDISQNKTTTIQLPTPGIVNLQKKYEVYGGIFIMKNNSLEKIFEIRTDAKLETIALSPGTYYLLYRPKYSKTMHNSKTIQFEILSGESATLNL